MNKSLVLLATAAQCEEAKRKLFMEDFAKFSLKEFRQAEKMLGIKEPQIDTVPIFTEEDEKQM